LAERTVTTHDSATALSLVAADVAIVFAFGNAEQDLALELPRGNWRKLLSSRDPCWQGPGDGVASELGGGSVSVRVPGSIALLLARTS
jgi:hypothetical protein